MTNEIPAKGFVLWNVGSGDAFSVIADDDHWLQIDINHKTDADKKDSIYVPIVDKLVERLPRVDGKPYLAVFALTHPDEDHCKGFERLLDEVEIGELWFTPRIFDEYKKDLCDDAVVFKEEALRRVKETVRVADPGTGNRVKIIGYSERLEEGPYKGFPEERLIVPGNAIEELDDSNISGDFCAFIHAPLKDDLEGDDRNQTSLAMQVRLSEQGADSNALFFGDHAYPVLSRIFENSDTENVSWGLMACPHHCSKSAMYWADSADDEQTLRQEILDQRGFWIQKCLELRYRWGFFGADPDGSLAA